MRVLLVFETDRGCAWAVPQADALLQRGHEVVALLPPGDGDLRHVLAERGVSVVDNPLGVRPSIAGVVRLRRTLRQLAPDVLLHHRFTSALAIRIAGAALGVAWVRMVAGASHLEARSARTVERVLARLDSVTVCANRFTARAYRAIGRPTGRTPIIPYGVDTRLFRPVGPAERAQVRVRLGVADEDFVVIMVPPAQFGHKGSHEVVLAAWRRFRVEHPGSHLLLVGAGEAGARHRARHAAAMRPGEEKTVTWLDTVEDVRPYYGAADLSVSPSRSGCHGNVLEASAMGVPSVVGDAGGLPEAVDPAACWVIPADDPGALATALHEAWAEHRIGGLSERGEAVRDRVVRCFDSTPAAEELADVLERSADRGRVSLFAEQRCAGDSEVYSDRVRLFTSLSAIVRKVLRARVIVVRQPGAIGVVAATVCKLLRREYFAEVVGDPADVPTTGLLGRTLARALMRRVVREASAVRYIPDGLLQRRYPAAPGRFTTGVPDAQVCRTEARDWRPAPHQIIAIGDQDRPHHGHDVLLRAVRRLLDDDLDVRVVLVGGGRRRDGLIALAGKLGLADHAHFTGPLPYGEVVAGLLNSADLFVAPCAAGTAHSLMTAMAYALPAVGTCAGGIPDLLEPDCLVPPGDDAALATAVRRLLTDKRAWEQQSRRNLEAARASGGLPEWLSMTTTWERTT
ncbi:hypothetical protein Lesp02_22980 [Lentzea sp. NBRC 105346]|nr:hypothetical protein Lesp02_22980 [Lentzea sp. NBRC 105346]